MKNVRQSNINIHRDSWVEINLEHLAFNLKSLKQKLSADMKLLAVVKADAYGHGAVMLAPTLLASGADMLGVASIDEGAELRQAKINCEILVLGAVPIWAVESAVKFDLTISIFSKEHLKACKTAYERTGIKPKVQIKLDTGMNRIGVSCEDAIEFIREVQNADYVELQGVFTHLANAENIKKTKLQISKWENIIAQIDTKNLLLHILNTAGTICYKVEGVNMCRAGISLYGLYPDLPQELSTNLPELKAVLGLKSRIVNIHKAPKGDGVSYGHTFIADGLRTIATIPLGYADGVPRKLSNKIYATLNGKKIKQIGNITMDQMMFDITETNAHLSDVISLIDENNKIDTWAEILDTINYELTCRLKVRLARVYTR